MKPIFNIFFAIAFVISVSVSVSVSVSAQTRAIGAKSLILDDGAGNTTTLLAAPGVSGTLTLPASGTLLTTGTTSSITSLGTIGTGTWQASIIGPAYGGTGINTSATPAGSILYTNGTGTWTTLAPGANTNVLTLAGGVPTWAAGGGGGFTNPMTTKGDIIYEDATPAPAGLAIGTTNQVLTVSAGGVPSWASTQSVVTHNYTHTTSSSNTIASTADILVYDGSATSITWTLPTASSFGTGHILYVYNNTTGATISSTFNAGNNSDEISNPNLGGYFSGTPATYSNTATLTILISDGSSKWFINQ